MITGANELIIDATYASYMYVSYFQVSQTWWTCIACKFLAATKQLWMVQSVRPYVRPSVCVFARHTFFTMSPSCIIMKFSGVIAIDRSDVHAKGAD